MNTQKPEKERPALVSLDGTTGAITNFTINGVHAAGGMTGVKAKGDVRHFNISNVDYKDRAPEEKATEWHTTWWGVSILTVFGGLIVAFCAYKFGWL